MDCVNGRGACNGWQLAQQATQAPQVQEFMERSVQLPAMDYVNGCGVCNGWKLAQQATQAPQVQEFMERSVQLRAMDDVNGCGVCNGWKLAQQATQAPQVQEFMERSVQLRAMDYVNGCGVCNGWKLAQQATQAPQVQALHAQYGGYSLSQSSSSDSSAETNYRMASGRARRAKKIATNPGSWGHPEACRKPCLYFSQGICQSGANCGFCHMPHPVITSGLDKRQRELFLEMPHQDVVALIYPYLCARIEDSHFSEECHRVLSVVRLELPAYSRVILPEDVLDRLNRVLDHLSFSSLISLICKKYDRQPFAAQVSYAMNNLRLKVAHLVNV